MTAPARWPHQPTDPHTAAIEAECTYAVSLFRAADPEARVRVMRFLADRLLAIAGAA